MTRYAYDAKGPPLENLFAPQYDPATTLVLNAARMTSIAQVGDLWTVTIDPTASNTPQLAGAILFPMRNVSNNVVKAGDQWSPPRALITTITSPGETSDMWIGLGICSGPDFTDSYSGVAMHYDAAPGPDRRRFADTIDPPADVAPLAGMTQDLMSWSGFPSFGGSGVRPTFIFRQPQDVAGAPLAAPGAVALASDYTLAPHIAFIFGSSTGGIATWSGFLGYERCAPVAVIQVGV